MRDLTKKLHSTHTLTSVELVRKLAESSSAKLAQSFALGPSFELARKLAESPSVKLAQTLSLSPSVELARKLAESPSAKLAQSFALGPSFELARKLAESPSVKLAQTLSLSPSVELARKLAESSSAKLAQSFALSPSFELARKLAESPSVKLAQTFSLSPSVELARKLAESSSAKLAQTIACGAIKPNSRMPGVYSLLTQFQEVQEDYESGRLSVDGQFIYNGQELASSQIRQAVNAALSTYIESPIIGNFETLLEGIYREIIKLKEPLYQKILTWLVMPIISGLLVLLIWNSANNATIDKELKSRTLKSLIHSITNHFDDKNILRDYRIVKADILNVRFRPKKQSRILGNLHFGDIVKVIQKNKNWSKVTWESADQSTSITGWVFTRYIQKINK